MPWETCDNPKHKQRRLQTANRFGSDIIELADTLKTVLAQMVGELLAQAMEQSRSMGSNWQDQEAWDVSSLGIWADK
ncbi:hypothetical protein PHISCL_08177 [Aspergillus sclerotialis]|uniref:Uncharacterized protein n=1 Tax=Aspergillus sclerotialis TaxID=2070753 RepID=A0A3A2Z8P5_9EURO|nr:hypothetical protein PHISCL_08177 [Aspergillus sclerotialis]